MARMDSKTDRRAEGGDTVELKNCPFCGGEAFVRKLYTNYIVDAKHGENCPMCYMCLPYDSRWATREAAVAAWNERIDPLKIESVIDKGFFEKTNEFYEYYAQKYHYPPYDISDEIDKIDNMPK